MTKDENGKLNYKKSRQVQLAWRTFYNKLYEDGEIPCLRKIGWWFVNVIRLVKHLRLGLGGYGTLHKNYGPCVYLIPTFFLWVYPHSTDVLAAAHLQSIEYYLRKRRHNVYNTIRGRDVLKECEGAERRRGTPPRLFWAEQDMTVPEQLDYGAEGGGSAPPPPASHVRVAPQARPTIAEERPREAMPVVDAAMEARCRAAHIND